LASVVDRFVGVEMRLAISEVDIFGCEWHKVGEGSTPPASSLGCLTPRQTTSRPPNTKLYIFTLVPNFKKSLPSNWVNK
jgi:hypothetical protein